LHNVSLLTDTFLALMLPLLKLMVFPDTSLSLVLPVVRPLVAVVTTSLLLVVILLATALMPLLVMVPAAVTAMLSAPWSKVLVLVLTHNGPIWLAV
jgi:hypothetical protein